ncbi:hypothetical protein Pfo_006446 [Paulownia fortunei]|nr:hypothetical protein Pfo_006446 [Paulownia fortunei]
MEQLFYALKQTQAKNIGPPNAILDMVHDWKGMGENLLKSLVDYVADIESREQNLSLVGESLEKRLKDLEEREREFDSFQEGRKRELALKERGLSPMWEDFAKEVELREDKLDEQLKLVHEHIESLEVAQSEVQDLRLLECEKLKEIEKREREIDFMAWSLEKRLREVEQREKQFDSFQDGKLRELASKEELLSRKREEFVKEVKLANEKLREGEKLGCGLTERLELALNTLEGMKTTIDERFKEIESWETVAHKSLTEILNEADLIRESLEKRFNEFEEMEKKFNSFQEDKMQELESKERQLSIMRIELLKEVKLRDEKLTKRFKEIESWETVAHKSLTVFLNEADLIRESLEKRFNEFEEMEKEFNSFQEYKMQKLKSKERLLSVTRKEVLREVKLRDEKLTEQQKLGHQLLECLEEMLARKLKEIESQEVTLNAVCETLDARAKDADLTRESANIHLQELEKRGKEYHLCQDKKMRELVLAEEKLRLIEEEFFQEVKFREEKFDKQVKMVHGLLERLELAQNNVKDMNTMVRERFKEIGLKEIELNHIRDWVERKTDELEFKAKELEEQEKEIKSDEDVAISKENELGGKKKELELKEVSLGFWRKEYECKEPHLEDVDGSEKSLNSVREPTQTCFRENLALNKLNQPERYLVGNQVGYLAKNDQQPECRPTELDLKGKQNGVHFKECELKQPQLTDALDAHLRVEPDESVDLKSAEQMDGKTLEIFINDTEKDLELMGAEVFKVLFLSSDPAKLVLDAIEGFYTPQLGKGDMKSNMRRKSILLLDQLTKMSPNIQPSVREAAIKLASEWKSKMRNTTENPLELLVFLHFLAAYNLSSCFDKDELLSFLKMVAQHKQTPELCRILGLTENIPGFIQNLINEKQYLLVSTYIYECELENMFPQAAVLNYYVQHSKFLAKAKCKRENNSSEAQDKAIASEITDLRVAIEHIIKYGLESEYSPDILTARIKQLERNRASLRNGMPSSSADVHKQEKSKRFAGNANKRNKRKAQQKQHEAAKEAAPASKAQMPQQGSEGGSSPAWKAQHWQSKTKKHPATTPVSFHEPWSQHEQETKSLRLAKLVDEVPMTHPSSAHKRRRTNISLHEGGLHLEGVRCLRSPPENSRLRR